MAKRAAALELLGLERWLRAWLAGFLWHTGAPAAAVDEAAELVRVAVEPRERRRAEVYLAQALVELGRFDEARRLVDGWRDDALTDSQMWAVVELEHWSGRPREALAVAAECLRRFPADGPPIFVRLIECWASLELGLDPGAPRLAPYHRMAEAAPAEERAVRALADGRPAEAAELLDGAAELWRGRHSRGEVRCLWGAGEAARRAGDTSGARRRLELAETRALECGALAVHARVLRSLRLAGARRTAARGERRPGITAREREVLALVGAGLSNAEIARRLGIGRPTVARLVTTASVRLGADSRLQAAVLAAQV
jgi:DNA-binding CsgD family transcriptional regulator